MADVSINGTNYSYPDQVVSNPDGTYSGGITGMMHQPAPTYSASYPQPPRQASSPSYAFNSGNVFNSWDLNPLASQTGIARDTLAQQRDSFLQPYYSQYRSAVGTGGGAGHAAADDYSLFNDPAFQAYVGSGQLPSASPSAQTTGGVASGTGNQFTDPYTSLYETTAKNYLNSLTGNNPQFTQLMNYINGQFQQKSQHPGYTPQELALLQTQALEPIENLRQASNQRAIQQASARGFLPTSGITGLQTGPDGQLESNNTAYDRMRAQAEQNIAAQAIGLGRQDQNTALQLAQLGLNVPNQQNQQALNVANSLYQLPHNALMDSLAVMNATNPAAAISPLVSLQGLAQQQGYYNQQQQAALWGQIGQLLSGLGL